MQVSPLVIPKEFAETEIRVYDKRLKIDDHDDLEW